MNNRRKYLIFFLIVVVGVALDQLSKWWAVTSFKDLSLTWPTRIQNPDAFFSWAYAENDGAFLSLGSSLPDGLRLVLLTIVPGVLLLAVMVYMLRSSAAKMLEIVVFSLISAGGIGNIVDRIAAGEVVDFMYQNYGFAHTGIFNVADLYIVIGIILYVLGYVYNNLIKKRAPVQVADSEPQESE